ncbi:N-acetyltransferase family protein [Streptococcus dentasini]
MNIRLAFPNEVSQIMTIIDDARRYLAESGSDQWQGAYPQEADIFNDILQGQAWVGLEEGEIVAYAAVIDGREPAYDAIYDGHWAHNNHRYITFHRIAVSAKVRGRGLAQTFLQGLIEGHDGPDFRCDTHEKNLAMRHILEKLGYIYCGKVTFEGERLAYQKIKRKTEKGFYQEVDEADYHSF